jgi:putative sigma-54 modulation protein
MVDIQVTGRNIKVTPKLDDYARRKIDRLDRYLPKIRDIHIDLAHQHNSKGEDMNIAQITVKHERGVILRAEEKTTGDMQQAIDTSVDKMYRQIMRFKGKRRDKRRRERYAPTLEEIEMAVPLPIEEMDDADEDTDYEVIRRKQLALIPMDENEAIEQMELLGHTFFMFHNAETGTINVVYRRKDSGYGLLEPMTE